MSGRPLLISHPCVLNDVQNMSIHSYIPYFMSKAILYHLHVLISCSILEPQRQFMYETAISSACIQRGPGMLLEHWDRCLEHNGRCIARRRGTKGVLIFCFFPLDKASSWGKGGFCLRYLRLVLLGLSLFHFLYLSSILYERHAI